MVTCNDLAQQLTGSRYGSYAVSPAVAVVARENDEIDVYRRDMGNAKTTLETDLGSKVLHLAASRHGVIVGATSRTVFTIRNGQVEHKRPLRHVKHLTVEERRSSFVVYVVTQEVVITLDCYLETIHANTHHLLCDKSSYPIMATSGTLSTNDGTKVMLSALAFTSNRVEFFIQGGHIHYGSCQLKVGPISQLTFSSFGQPLDQPGCLVAASNQLFVIRSEDFTPLPLLTLPHAIARFALFETKNVLIVACENNFVAAVSPTFELTEVLNQGDDVAEVALDGPSETILLFHRDNTVTQL